MLNESRSRAVSTTGGAPAAKRVALRALSNRAVLASFLYSLSLSSSLSVIDLPVVSIAP